MKNTQGTWKVIKLDMADFKQICIASNVQTNVIAHLYLPDYKITPQIEADAKLMSAAPDLLESTKELLALLSFHGYNHSTEITKAQDAILKASLTTVR